MLACFSHLSIHSPVFFVFCFCLRTKAFLLNHALVAHDPCVCAEVSLASIYVAREFNKKIEAAESGRHASVYFFVVLKSPRVR